MDDRLIRTFAKRFEQENPGCIAHVGQKDVALMSKRMRTHVPFKEIERDIVSALDFYHRRFSW